MRHHFHQWIRLVSYVCHPQAKPKGSRRLYDPPIYCILWRYLPVGPISGLPPFKVLCRPHYSCCPADGNHPLWTSQTSSSENAGNDEIGILSGAYNFMTAEINELLNQKELAAKELQKAEFRALQAQINPHFLYNTLDMINWLAKSGQISQVSQAVQALTRFYRLTLGQKELFGTIDDEITHCNALYAASKYALQSLCRLYSRHSPRAWQPDDPQTDLPANCRKRPSARHLNEGRKKGCILLTGWREGEDAVLVISDDGAGIAPEKLDTLLDSLSADNGLTSLRHIGVSNTNLRLKSLYGDAYGLSLPVLPVRVLRLLYAFLPGRYPFSSVLSIIIHTQSCIVSCSNTSGAKS